jgi:putative transposase
MKHNLSEKIRRRLRPRFPGFDYIGAYYYFITICCFNDLPKFAKSWDYDRMLTYLRQTSERHHIRVLIYCFMPDHLHLLLESSENTDMVEFIRLFKQLTSYDYKKRTGLKLWQDSFYDSVLDGREGIMELASYILANPVRKGMVTEALDYRYSGSFVYSAEDLAKSIVRI